MRSKTMADADICMPRVVRESITIRVRGLRTVRLRMWLAAKVFIIGAWVAGVGIEIDAD
jgi:hypothetical protein